MKYAANMAIHITKIRTITVNRINLREYTVFITTIGLHYIYHINSIMGKALYFEVILVFILLTAAFGRILFPEVRQKEIEENPFLNGTTSYVIIFYELMAVYFLLYATSKNKKMYLLTYIIAITLLSLYFMATLCDFRMEKMIDTFKSVCVYTPNPHSVVVHTLIILMMVYIVYIK